MGAIGETLFKDNKPLKYAVTGLVIAGSSLALLLVAKKVLKDIKLDKSKETAKDLGKEVNQNNIFKTEAEFKAIADAVYGSLDYSGSMNLSALEYELKKLKSLDEWKKLVAVFGQRKASATFSWFEGNLIEWLNYKLNVYTRPKVTAILSKIGATL